MELGILSNRYVIIRKYMSFMIVMLSLHSKECERQRRCATEPIEFFNLETSSKIPVQTDKFWASSNNKEKLQKLSRDYFKEIAVQNDMGFVLSGYVQSDNEVKVCDKVAGDGSITDVPNLKSVLEEADLRLIPHISKAIDENYRRVVVVSSDTDVVALILYYMPRFILAGLSELWVRFGSGNSSRFLPMHQFAYQLGQEMCAVIMKAHILTGCDVTSKVGTKVGALRNDPELYITQFGEQDYLTGDVTKKAEENLVNVWQTKAGTKETTFDGLRFESYVGKKTSILDLPPTSSSVHGHLERCHYVVRQQTLLLDELFDKNPRHHGWRDDDGLLVPEKHLAIISRYYTVRCGCKMRCSNRCSCIQEGALCTEFCGCRVVIIYKIL